MDTSYFVFRNQFYEQIEGTAMGNPLSPVLADLVMGILLDTVTSKTDIVFTVLRKYVDDLMLVIPADRLQQVLDIFNSYHPSIQFTFEVETDGRLPYLDMTLVRQEDDTIRTEWYMKAIASGRLLNFSSLHPLTQKINTIKNVIDRVNRLSTNWDEEKKREVIAQILQTNDYPRNLINRFLNRTHWTSTHTITADDHTTEEHTIGPPQAKIYRSLPYIPSLTPKISQILRHDYPSVIICPRSVHTIRDLYTRIKDPIPMDHHHNVVYRIQCGNCDKCYIGMTGNLLKKRLSGHRSNLNQLENLLESGRTYADEPVRALREKTALLAHCIDHDHRFIYETTRIVDRTYKRNILPILEMIHISNDNDSINKRTDTDRLSSTLSGLIHRINTVMTKNTNGQNNRNTNHPSDPT
ncbi:uncharacterized protein LOC134287419 [Aedes albopictus]|uniref:Reverse transcriptase domain-containing protein n=1 Tax=Aedes albopictus TaxID=7160 RepID=A0ABM1Z7L3_AEDAL